MNILLQYKQLKFTFKQVRYALSTCMGAFLVVKLS
jgi:hypothetical protein